MAKTHNNLYSKIYEFENLYNAYIKARKNKRYRDEVLLFSANLEENLIKLQNELIHKTYKPGKYRQFYVYDPKTRLVMAAPFHDRVVHHALCNIIEPIFDKKFIHDSYACRSGRGTHNGVARAEKFLRAAALENERVYCFKADVSKYFQSVNINVLKSIIMRKISCNDTFWLIENILDSTADDGDLNPLGMPIGNLTSQLFANIYLNELDHFMKHDQQVRRYIRYMDDFIIIHHDKKYLNQLWKDTVIFLQTRLGLQLNRKTSVFPIEHGIDFLGYRIWPTHKLLRKANVKRIKRVVKKLVKGYKDGDIPLSRIQSVMTSWVGHASRADVYHLRRRIEHSVKEMISL